MMTTTLGSQCLSCSHFRSPLDTASRNAVPSCSAFDFGIPDDIWSNTADHRREFSGDNGIRWDGNQFPEYALTGQERSQAVRPFVRTAVAAHLCELLRNFDEGKVKRDRKGRFAKSAAQIVSELDDLMAKLTDLTHSMDQDGKDDADNALDYLKDLRKSHVAKIGRRDAVLETSRHGEISMMIHGDGDVGIDFDDESIFFPPTTAKELAAGLDELRALDAPPHGDGQAQTVVGKVTSSDGEFAVARWSGGVYDVGPTDSVGVNSPDDAVLELEDDDDELANFADLLEELADTSLKGGAAT